MKETTPQRRKNNFDQLRLIAAFFVIITHSYALLGFPETDMLYQFTNGTTSFSRFGLWVFFVISGYLVTASALRSTSVFVYIKKRFLRILPGFFVVIAFGTFVVGALFTTLSVTEYFFHPITWDYLKGLTFFRLQYNLPGVFDGNPYPGAVNGSLWTIPYELILYVLPAMVLLISRVHLKRYVKPVLLICWIIALFTSKQFGAQLWNYTIPVFLLNGWHLFNFGMFFVGGMLAWLYKDVVRMHTGVFVALLIIWIGSWFTSYAVVVSYVCVPYIILWIAQKPVITSRNIQAIPDISYGLYLYAFPVQQSLAFFIAKTISVGWFAILSLCVTIPFAYISWRYIEEPFLRLKRIK